MRLCLALALLATPATAWDFRPLPVCTVSDETDTIATSVTYDPVTKLYAIALTLPEPWAQGPMFSIRFTGPRGLTIGTDRHVISADGRTLSVSDTGFGNVLDGLQYNETATATIGGQDVIITLDGAAEPVERFRNCGAALTG